MEWGWGIIFKTEVGMEDASPDPPRSIAISNPNSSSRNFFPESQIQSFPQKWTNFPTKAIPKPSKMERHVQIFLNRLSYASIAIATLTLLFLFLRSPVPCLSPPRPISNPQFPKSSCDVVSRNPTTLEKRNHRLWSTRAWQSGVSSYGDFFRDLALLRNHSKVLCVSAGAGHAAAALARAGVGDVTAVEIVESPPLVRRADPHSLPFFDAAFDFAFSASLADALLPARVAAEMERAVRPGGACVVAVEECGDEEVAEIAGLFRNSELVGSLNVTLTGLRMTRIVMKRNKISH